VVCSRKFRHTLVTCIFSKSNTIIWWEMHNLHLLLNSNTTTTHIHIGFTVVYTLGLCTLGPLRVFFILLQACCSGSTGSWGVKNTIEMHNFITLCHMWHFSQYTMIFTVWQCAKQMKVQCSKCKEKRRLNQAESVISQLAWPSHFAHESWIARCGGVLLT
jgi:hypothetical protein